MDRRCGWDLWLLKVILATNRSGDKARFVGDEPLKKETKKPCSWHIIITILLSPLVLHRASIFGPIDTNERGSSKNQKSIRDNASCPANPKVDHSGANSSSSYNSEILGAIFSCSNTLALSPYSCRKLWTARNFVDDIIFHVACFLPSTRLTHIVLCRQYWDNHQYDK